jgi:hypothetical protein
VPTGVQDCWRLAYLAGYLVNAVDGQEPSTPERAYDGRGSNARRPATLLSMLFDACAARTCSSRKIGRSPYDSQAFRHIVGKLDQDHDALATFRTRFDQEFASAFVQVENFDALNYRPYFRLKRVSFRGLWNQLAARR